MPNTERKQARPGQTTSGSKKTAIEAGIDSDTITHSDIKKLQDDAQQGVKEAWKFITKNRYKIIQLKNRKTYKSDRWIWNGAMLLVFFWLWLIAYSSNYNLDYFKCGDGERLYQGEHQTCHNPFYKPEQSWKCSPELGYGEYGTRPSKLFNNAGLVTVIILVLAGLLNHIIHNKRRR